MISFAPLMFIFVNRQSSKHLRSMVDNEKLRDHKHWGRVWVEGYNGWMLVQGAWTSFHSFPSNMASFLLKTIRFLSLEYFILPVNKYVVCMNENNFKYLKQNVKFKLFNEKNIIKKLYFIKYNHGRVSRSVKINNSQNWWIF